MKGIENSIKFKSGPSDLPSPSRITA